VQSNQMKRRVQEMALDGRDSPSSWRSSVHCFAMKPRRRRSKPIFDCAVRPRCSVCVGSIGESDVMVLEIWSARNLRNVLGRCARRPFFSERGDNFVAFSLHKWVWAVEEVLNGFIRAEATGALRISHYMG
jgi:hypothetical protein